jgi:hypothetical protein
MRASLRKFNYVATAELFPGRSPRAATRGLKYVLLGTYLEVAENRYNSNEIRFLYERAEHPFRRVSKAA